MKKIIALVVMLAFASAAQAREMSDGKKDRKGFMLGFGLGAGAAHFQGGGDSDNKAVFLSDVRIGGGLTEKILLMCNSSVDYSRFDSVNLMLFHSDVAAQFFVWEGFFLRPSLGISKSRASTDIGGTTYAVSGKWSFGGSLATGYEFRFGKYFALSPELLYRYTRIRGNIDNANAHAVGAQAGLTWYF